MSTISAINQSIVCPVLVGREADLAALKAQLEQVQCGHGSVMLLAGEAGIGKSRLVAATKTLAARLDFIVLQGNCFEQDRVLPYAPIVDLLRNFYIPQMPSTLAEHLRPYASDLIKLLPELSTRWPDLPQASSLEAEQEKRRLFQTLTHLLTKSPGAKATGLLLILEDLHWCDDISLDFLLYFARRIASQSLLLLLTYRDNEVSAGLRRLLAALDREHLARELSLTRFTATETAAMLQAIFNLMRAPQADFLNALYELTDGNPFFIEEVLKVCVAEGAIFQTGGQWGRKPLSQISIPRTVQLTVQQRIEQLTSAAQRLLMLAAVAGQRCNFDLLLRASGQDERTLIGLLKELVAAQLVSEETPDHFTFRHALTRQTVYVGMFARERRLLHRTIAETLEQIDTSAAFSASLAYHFEAAGLWEKTLVYAQRAGEKAQALQSSRAAVEQWSRALNAAQQLTRPPAPDLLRARGQALEQLGEFEAARHDFEAVLALVQVANDPRMEWQALLDLGFLWTGRNLAQADTYFQRALTLTRILDERAMLAHTLNRIGNWHVNAEQPHRGRLYHEEALAIFTDIGDEAGLAATIDLLAGALYFSGETVQGMACYAEAVEHFRRLGDRRGLASSLTWLTYRGPTPLNPLVALASLSLCIPCAEEALQLARAIEWRPAEGFALFALAFCFGAQGDYGRALTAGHTGLKLMLELEHAWIPIGRNLLGWLYLDLFALPLAQAHLEQSHHYSKQNSSVLSERVSGVLLAATFIAQEKFEQAERLLDQLAAIAPSASAHTTSPTLAQRMGELVRARLALKIGQPARALQLVETLITEALRLAPADAQLISSLPLLQGEALTALNRMDEAEQALLRARQAAHDQEARAQLWRIEAALGQLYQQQGRHEADAHFATARQLIQALATTIPDVAQRDNFLHQALLSLPTPVTSTPLRAAKQAFDGLTERERTVATLIAQGKSDREIAAFLILSKRTVSTHVGNILNKLGFSSRSQIAAWAASKGL